MHRTPGATPWCVARRRWPDLGWLKEGREERKKEEKRWEREKEREKEEKEKREKGDRRFYGFRI